MRVLLATPLYSSQHLDAGLFWLRAINRLGHSTYVWDYRLDPKPPAGQYDFTLVLKGMEVDPVTLPRPRVVYWPDDINRTPGVEKKLALYDKVYTCLRPTPNGMVWLPTGFDPEIHCLWDSPKLLDSVFVGTHTPYKANMLKFVCNPTFYRTAIYGNGWHAWSGGAASQGRAIYLHEYVAALRSARVCINIHHDPNIGLNRRIFEMIACGLTISDRVPGVEEVLGDLTESLTFRTPDEANEVLSRWLHADPELVAHTHRLELSRIAPYTYENVARRILDV